MIGLLLTLALSGPIRPNLATTPGAVRPLSKQTLCATKWGLDRRHVTLTMKKTVFASYGIPWAQHAKYEVDHFIPRELGGADEVANLWPETWTGDANAHMKDRLENRLHVLVCRGTMPLETARTALTSDWIAAFRLYVAQP